MPVKRADKDTYTMELIASGMPLKTVATLSGATFPDIRKFCRKMEKRLRCSGRAELTRKLRQQRKVMELYAAY